MENKKSYKRSYNALYKKIQSLGQDPGKYKPIPKKKDIERLHKKVKTINEYNKIARRYRKSYEYFTSKYFVKTKEIDTSNSNITKQSVKALKRKYEKYQQERQKFVRSIPKEVKVI